MPQPSPEQVQSIQYFPGPRAGLGIGRAGTCTAAEPSSSLRAGFSIPRCWDFCASRTSVRCTQATRQDGKRAERLPREDAGSSLLWPGHPPPHWEHIQLILGKGLPGSSQIPRGDASGSHRFRTQAAPPCCISFSAMYHAIAIKMQSFYSLHNFNYF